MKVSVCIATYNGEKYILEQLQSILNQLKAEDEVIISDDGSWDNTLNIIGTIPDSRIKIMHNQQKHGYTPNFENALKHAEGDIIFLSDQDDVWLSGKYDKVISLLEKYDLVVTNSKVTDENLNVLNDSFFDLYNSGKGILKNTICNTYYGSCMGFKRKILDYAMPFPENKEIGFDIWLGFVAEIVGEVYFLKDPYLLYRRSDESVTVVGGRFLSRSKRPFFQKIYKRIILLWHTFLFGTRYKLSLK